MIYTPSLSGHRELACGIIGNIYLGMQHKIYLLVPFKIKQDLIQWRHIAQFLDNENVTFLSTIKYSKFNSQLSAEDIGNLQYQFKIDLTIFEEGDFFIEQFIRLSENIHIKKYGKNAAIFTHTLPWFPGENPSTGIPNSISPLGYIKDRIKKVVYYKSNYSLLAKLKPSCFFPEIVMKKKILSTALMADERIPDRFGNPFRWMPTMYKSFTLEESKSDIIEFNKEKQKFERFLDSIRDKEILLYFGTSSKYKGYLKMLDLAIADADACFVHCGKLSEEFISDLQITSKRRILYHSGRIYETGKYISSQKLVEYFFNSAKHIVSTHNFLGPSGTLIQAIKLQKNILTPDKGHVGYRTRENNLGITYEHNNSEDLYRKWLYLKDAKKEKFVHSLIAYSDLFSEEALTSLYKSIL